MSAPRHRSLPVRLLLACFVAQGAWWLVMLLALAASLMLAVDDVSSESQNVVDMLLQGSLDLGGIKGSLLQFVLVATVVGGLVLMAGIFVVPVLLRIFIRIICGGLRASYAWALVANLASWISLVAISLLLWVIPGAQPVAAFVMWIGSSILSAMLLYPHLRMQVEPAPPTTTDIDRKAT